MRLYYKGAARYPLSMDLLEQVGPAFFLTRRHPALKAYLAFFVAVTVGFLVVAGTGFLAFRGPSISLPLAALTILFGLAWFVLVVIGDLLLKSGLILQGEKPGEYRTYVERAQEDLLGLVAVSALVGLCGIAVSLALLPLRLALPSLALPFSLIQFLINLLLGAALGYALFFRLLHRENILNSLGKSLQLFLEQPLPVLCAFLLVAFLSLVVLGALVIFVLILAFVASLLLAALKSSPVGLALVGLMALVALLVGFFVVAHLSVFLTLLFRRFFFGFTASLSVHQSRQEVPVSKPKVRAARSPTPRKKAGSPSRRPTAKRRKKP